MEDVYGILLACYSVTKEIGAYLVIGFIIAGLIKACLKEDTISKSLGKNNFFSVLKASLIGIPLPLCSCSVIPVAISLKRKGASNGAVSSFLVSTPETGIDSIALSYALLDPIFTIFRPLIAFVTSLVAGLSQNILDQHNHVRSKPKTILQNDSNNDTDHSLETQKWWIHSWNKIKEGVIYAFHDLLPDIAKPLFYGILLTGLFTYYIPENFFTGSNPILSMFIMLLIGIPMYTCATASTPIAAALILKGLNPGAALVFLLVGPATNMVTISALMKIMGRKGLIIYFISIILTTFLAGILLDFIYYSFSIEPSVEIGRYSDLIADWVKEIFGILLSGYLTYIILGNLVWKVKKLILRKSE